jgi:phenylacetic acid degradation operon negative regulatory protein
MTSNRLPTTSLPDVRQLAADFGRRGDISARSVIVTIFGDSIVPAGGQVWLGDLIELCQPFGFTHRLVRTSMFRLAGEGWFDIERVGRRSRYALTERATAEFAEAEARIYRLPEVAWDGRWTIVFLDPRLLLDPDASQALRASLGWHGYASLSAGVMAIPRDEADQVRRLAARAGVTGAVPVATARFADLAPLVDQGWLAEAFGIDVAAGRYDELVDRYRWTGHLSASALRDGEAFCLRTMLVHDLRRARLADPDLPAGLLPARWPGPGALRLVAAAYDVLSPGTGRWLAAAGLPIAARTAARPRFS